MKIKIHHGREIKSMELQHVGGKAKGLSFLQSNGLKIPEFYVIDFESVKSILSDNDQLEGAIVTWVTENKISDKDLWAVRSSAADEDGNKKSFAGQFTSVLNLKKDQLAEGILKVVGSYNRETQYAEKSKAFGVVIQKMLVPSYSGVFFSRDPILHYSDQPVISIIPGIGDKLVSGKLDGYHIHFENGKPIFKGEEEIEGESFRDGHRFELTCSQSELVAAIQPHFESMISDANKFEKIYNCALDFEFAIEDDEFFWLQIRPVTTRELHPLVLVWDNTSVEANYPGTTLPLSISSVKKTYSKAYFEAAKSLGFHKKVLKENKYLLTNMAGGIDGALYYNVTAWQTIIYQMPFGSKLSKKLPDILGMNTIDFKKTKVSHTYFDKLKIAFNILGMLLNGSRYEKNYMDLYREQIQDFDLRTIEKDSLQELINKYLKIENELGTKWLAPLLNGFHTMLLMTLLKRKVRRSKIGKDYPNFINDILLADGDVKSVQLVKRFQEIMLTIFNSPDLKQFFTEKEKKEIWEQLPLKFESFHKDIIAYINEFGNRTDNGELKMETITYKQNPELFIQFIQSNLKGFRPIEKSTEIFNYKEIVRKYTPINLLNRWWFNTLVKNTIRRVKARENYRFMRTDAFALMRVIFLQMGKVLKSDGIIESSRDVLYLEMEELFDLGLQNNYKTIIENRKSNYLVYNKKERPNRYMQVKEKYFGIHHDEVELEGNELKGIACCSGLVTKEVIVVNEETDFDQDFTNNILVASFFEPGWVNLFYQAKGIISERGSLLSHTAIICRELNVPSIVGVKGLLRKIKTGDTVTMDGERGIIKIHEDE